MPRKLLIYKVLILKLADRTGLEPATSAVTGRHSNQLNYRSFSVGVAKISVFHFHEQKFHFLLFNFVFTLLYTAIFEILIKYTCLK